MTAANDLGLTTAVPAQSTIYADTYPRAIEIEANVGDAQATKHGVIAARWSQAKYK